MSDPRADDRITRGLPTPPPTGIQPNLPDPAPLPNLAGGPAGGGAADDISTGGGLSSLAQSAREKQINSARVTLFIIGGLTIVLNIVWAFMGPSQFDAELRKAGLNPQNLAPEHQAFIRFALMMHYAVCAGFALMGVVFIVLGVLVRKYPVPCTIAGLALFLLGNLIQFAIYPASLAANWIFKIIIVVLLVKAIQAALAAEREKREALTGMDHAY